MGGKVVQARSHPHFRRETTIVLHCSQDSRCAKNMQWPARGRKMGHATKSWHKIMFLREAHAFFSVMGLLFSCACRRRRRCTVSERNTTCAGASVPRCKKQCSDPSTHPQSSNQRVENSLRTRQVSHQNSRRNRYSRGSPSTSSETTMISVFSASLSSSKHRTVHLRRWCLPGTRSGAHRKPDSFRNSLPTKSFVDLGEHTHRRVLQIPPLPT